VHLLLLPLIGSFLSVPRMLVSQILVIFPRSLSQARHQISDKHIIKDHLKALRRNYDLVTEDFKAEECGAKVVPKFKTFQTRCFFLGR
jgi:hypothetical protein